MKLGIMQPYFFPYIGYFQLIEAVDTLVVYDNIQYTKKGWINRNRYLRNGTHALFSIPLKKDSDFLNVDQRVLSPAFNRRTLLNQVKAAYMKAPFFETTFPLFVTAVEFPEVDLFRYVKHSIDLICAHVGITTTIIDSSSISIDHALPSQDKVLVICKALDATMYINAIGGTALYTPAAFASKGIDLGFIESERREYRQFGKPFVPWLSMLDVLMFNSPGAVTDYLTQGFSIVSRQGAVQ